MPEAVRQTAPKSCLGVTISILHDENRSLELPPHHQDITQAVTEGDKGPNRGTPAAGIEAEEREREYILELRGRVALITRLMDLETETAAGYGVLTVPPERRGMGR